MDTAAEESQDNITIKTNEKNDTNPFKIQQKQYEAEPCTAQLDTVNGGSIEIKLEPISADNEYSDVNENDVPINIKIERIENDKDVSTCVKIKKENHDDTGIIHVKLEMNKNDGDRHTSVKERNENEQSMNMEDDMKGNKNNEDTGIWIKVETNVDNEQLYGDGEIKGIESNTLSTPVLSAPGIPNIQPLPSVLELERAEARRLIAEKQMFACDECDTRFTLKNSLIRHKKKFHRNERDQLSSDSQNTGSDGVKDPKLKKQFKCDLCNKKLSQIKTLRSHVMTYHGPAFTCDVCSKPFYLESDFKSHCHDSDKPYSCDMCDKRFLYEIWLERHKVVVHTKPYACEVCGKRFTKNCLLIRHKPVHTGEKLYTCDICSKSFKQKFSLTHHRETHTGDLSYYCDICKRRFSSKMQMKAHIKGHKEKQFQCNICDKKFRIKSHLEYHKPVHYGDKPFACDSCGERFSEKTDWLSHKASHDSTKRFQCDICQRRFIRKFSLIGHKKNIHSKEKPFSCGICGKNYALKKHYDRHSKTHKKFNYLNN